MSKNQILLLSLALDLKRVALGYNRGSIAMAERFLDEVIERRKEIDETKVRPYVRKLLEKLDVLAREKNRDRVAEDALMYSTLFQNASQL